MLWMVEELILPLWKINVKFVELAWKEARLLVELKGGSTIA